MKSTIAFLFSLFLAGTAVAQPHPTMPIVVEADRVKIGSEFLKRCVAAPTNKIIAAGQTETIPSGTFDCIEVGGTFKIDRTVDTVLKFRTMYVLPGGHLDVGAAADPVACNRHVEFIVTNAPLNPLEDPFQWGNGLINFGDETRVGCPKTDFLQTTGSLAAGAMTLTLEAVPDNWNVGDELLIPDTDKPPVTGNGLELTAVPSRREAKVLIAAISGTSVTLSKGLDFAHLQITDLDGNVYVRPYVANLTRNIVIRSENSSNPQAGTRGHTADIGEVATWDIRFNKIDQMGRTGNTPLDDTVLGSDGTITHQGTNQRGKYAVHFHHAGTSPDNKFIGNVITGHPGTTKWAVAVHATHDTLIQNNVGTDFPGAIFVTEDGYEVRNVFDHNLAAYSMGIPGDQFGSPDNAHIANNCPGCSGAGFWLRGVRNSWTRNVGINNFRGIDLFNQQGVAGTYPSAPGILPDTPFVPTDARLHQPIKFKDNIVVGNAAVGLEIWATLEFPDENLIAANNDTQVAGVLSDGIGHHMINPVMICKPETGSTGMIAGQAYSQVFHLEGGGKIVGCHIGLHGGGGSAGMFIGNIPNQPHLPGKLVFQNEINIDQIPHVADLDVLFVPLGSHPHQNIILGNVGRFSGTFWTKKEPLPDVGDSDWKAQFGSQWKLRNFQNTGTDYLILHEQQLEDKDAWYPGPGPHGWNCHDKGLTMLQCWQKWGQSWNGDVLLNADKVALDGLINGYGRKTFNVTLSQPRAVVTFPNMDRPAVGFGEPNNKVVQFSALATGDLSNTCPTCFFIQVDNNAAFNLGDYITFAGSDRSFNQPVGADGTHHVKVWLTQKNAPTVPVPGSEMTQDICLGPTCKTTVPGVQGLTPAYASNAIISALLTVAPTNASANSDTIQAGGVIGTIPPFDTVLDQNTPVQLVISLGAGTVPTTATVPSVVGKTGAEADTLVRAVGLTLGTVGRANSPDVPFGIVISQNPASGVVVNLGSAVDIVVSDGPVVPTTTTVPAVLGKTQAAATADITAAQLMVGAVTQAFSQTVALGLVMTQTPAAGATVNLHSNVDLVISRGPVPPPPSGWNNLWIIQQNKNDPTRYQACKVKADGTADTQQCVTLP